MKSAPYFLFALGPVVVAACGSASGSGNTASANTDSMIAAAQLPLPEMPDSLVEPRERVDYLLMHFWDAMDWRDSRLTGSEDFMEQNAANFYDLFRLTDSLTASAATARMLDGAAVSPEAYHTVASIAEKYLYDPNSPMLDEESYLIVTDRLVADKKLSDGDMVRVADRRRRMLQNRVGTQATDFDYTARDGSRSTLRALLKERPYTVVMFYDTDCDNCKEVEHQLVTTPELARGIEAGLLNFLAVSPFEVDTAEWAHQAATFPPTWTVGYSPEGRVDADELYDIRATPAIYVIARDGSVTGKDVRADNLREWINFQLQQHN